ncbi:LOW QUALITY PROTEIN: probable helicase with zinc finger domain [Rhagoletis pomonella]|uniref:LOW QUALITY PROTEIN: probable helicase with zinc finger domain n=1 Tax=Rhagoletis pomonella TaxID=28610 RepID=UPI00178096EB|nr:LOW QUALITY PROTEIN: probable helicase with zinc finger domain [Rhagoletis pomonella]
MTEKEMQAHDFVRRRNWSRAVSLYDQILAQISAAAAAATIASANGNNTAGSNNNAALARSQKDRQIACLLGRCECMLELNRYEQCLSDARKVLALLADQSADCLASVSRARRWLVHALCKLKKYNEAEQLLREWIGELSGQQSFLDISKTLERYKSIIQMINGHKSTQKISQSRLEDEMSILDTKLDHWATNNLPLDKYSKLLSNKGLKKTREGGSERGGGDGRGNGGNNSNNIGGPGQHNGSLGSGGGSSSISSSSSSGSGSSTTILQKTTDLLAAIKVTGGKHGIPNIGVAAEENDNATYCSYCAISFETRNELRQHCQTERHQNVIMSYEGRDWKWRPPPRGYTLDSYSLCEAYQESQTCHYGNQCVEAHGQDELNEWKERFEYRRMRLQKASEKELYGKSYTEQILDRWIQATAPERIMCEKVDGVEVRCEQELVTSISSKSSKREWIFVLKSSRVLRAVALLQDAHRNHFAITGIKVDSAATIFDLKSNQEWVSATHKVSPGGKDSMKPGGEFNDTTLSGHINATTDVQTSMLEHKVTIEFHTDIYGTFRQTVCFDLGTEPLLVQQLCVDVVPVGDAERIEEIKRDIINSSVTRWDISNTNLVKFETTIGTHLKTEAYLNDLKHEKEMLERYPCPRAQTFTLTQSTIVEKRLTQHNYRSRIHELLYVEEIARYEQIARYNVRTKLTVTSNYILTPAGMATSTAKFSLTGELFALMRLGKDISEDTSAGRLILSNCSSVYISAPEELHVLKDRKRNVYEATIEDKGKNVIYLKLSAKCVDGMNLKADTEIEVDIQFQLNRLPYCEWHNAVDKITDFKIIFPATEIEPNIPWTPKKQWSDACEPKLNAKQREAVNAITTSLSIKLPPILLIGPFGTGKTYTLAQAIKQLLTQPEAKILICTHSNSAADLYIKEYLHPWIEQGLEEATPLRVYYHKRWVATVNSVVQKYCITDGAGNFRRPSVEDIKKHRIVVVTLSISMELANLGLPKGYFTHIFLDEAAQAMECEAIMPLALANDSTRIVLAGDHMQMSPELFSAFAKERKLHISLLERLYDHYPSNFPCKILLCENYRAHEAIIKFTSELFYEQKLIASGKQPRHERFYPLTFFTTRGEDVQDKNSTAFYNNAEVYEVVERVSELRRKWPIAWGKVNDASIGIMTPYADQVFRIRSELRKRRMGGISVERVLNVQGKQFRAVFLSTVRTRATCLPQMMNALVGPAGMHPGMGGGPMSALGSVPAEDTDFGFLSNSKLLNTAITRAQSLVAVVGDPVALCSIGRCRKVWERFIEICDENKSLFGITWSYLRSQLDGVELKRGYVLNPLAPEFIPRAMQPEAYLRDQTAMYLMGAAAANASNHHGAPHPGAGPHHPGGPLPPHAAGMLAAAAAAGAGGGPGGTQMQPHHAAMAAAANHQQQMQMQMYAQHPAAAAAYNAAAAAAVMMNQSMAAGKGGASGHHFPGPGHGPNHMNMRAMGPHQPGGPQQQPGPPPSGPLGQQYNMRGPPPPPSAVHLPQPPPPGTTGPPSQFAAQYMPWQQAQQLRGGPPGSGGTGGNYPPPGAQQQGPPQSQNPNASLWGPPPQSNPWSALPNKQAQMPPQPPPNSIGAGGGARQMGPPPPNSQQQQQSGAGMRGGSVPLQPPPPNAQQLRANSNDMGYLTKKGYGPHGAPIGPQQQPPPPHGSFGAYVGGNAPPPPPSQLQLLNQRNLGGGMPNGPISPLDPYMQRGQGGGSAQAGAPQSSTNFFGGAGGVNNISALGKDSKDFQFLNNVHMPQLNLGGSGGGGSSAGANNLFQPPGALQPPAPGNNKQQSPSAPRFPQPQEYAALLPPNMSIYDMAFEPKESQYKWCLKLLETHGQEAVNKFTEGLGQVLNMLNQQQQQQQHAQQLNARGPQMQPPPPPPHLNVNQLLPRDLMQQYMLPALMGGGNSGVGPQPPMQQQQQQQHQQQQRNSLIGSGMHHTYPMNPLAAAALSNQQGPQQQPPPPPSLLPPPTDETPPLDGINFNQQIDLAFNTLLNGNNAQPILRNLFSNTSSRGTNANSLMNGGDFLLPSSTSTSSLVSTSTSASGGGLSGGLEPPAQQQQMKLFPGLGGGGGGSGVGDLGGGNILVSALQQPLLNSMQKGPLFAPMPHQQQQQQQHMHSQPPTQQQQPPVGGSFLGGNSLLNSKDYLLGGDDSLLSGGSSVPLYRRQAMGNGSLNNTLSNSISMSGNSAGGNSHSHSHNSNHSNYNSVSGHSGTGGGSNVSGHLLPPPDNILTGGTTDILAGLNTSASNLIEALFQTNSTTSSAPSSVSNNTITTTTGLEQQQQQQQQQSSGGSNSSSFQKMFNSYDIYGSSAATAKKYELDLFMRDHQLGVGAGGSGGSGVGGVGTGGNVSGGNSGGGDAPLTNNHHTHYHNNNADNRNSTTYAAVLSQGQHHQQQQQQQQHHQQQHHHQQQQQQQHHAVQQQQHHNNFHHHHPSHQAEPPTSGVSSAASGGGGVAAGSGGNAGSGGGGIEVEKDLFAAIRELGQGTNGFYNYFQ